MVISPDEMHSIFNDRISSLKNVHLKFDVRVFAICVQLKVYLIYVLSACVGAFIFNALNT